MTKAILWTIGAIAAIFVIGATVPWGAYWVGYFVGILGPLAVIWLLVWIAKRRS